MQICPKCERPLRRKDKVRAVVLTEFIDLKSKSVFAIEMPYDCERIEHLVCGQQAEGD